MERQMAVTLRLNESGDTLDVTRNKREPSAKFYNEIFVLENI